MPGWNRVGFRSAGSRAAALIAAAAAMAPLAGCGSDHSTGGPPARAVGPESLFEDDAQLHAHPARFLNLVKRLGVARLRVYIPWDTLAPSPRSRGRPRFGADDPAAYPEARWAIYDTIVRDASARGIGLDFTVGGPPPRWASGTDTPGGKPFPEWKPSAREFGEFMRAIATRYDGRYRPTPKSRPLPRVSFWAIWNEPNYGPNLAPQAIAQSTVAVSPGMYRGLLDAAWSALQRTGHGHDTILIGELAPRGITIGDSPGNFSGMVPLRFVRALYCVDANLHPFRGAAAALRDCPTGASGSERFASAHPALFEASGFSDHPYPQGSVPPNVVTPDEPDYADLATIPNLERTLDKVQAVYGSHRKFSVYSTEFGYQTNPPESISRAAGVRTAAAYMNWAEYISWRNPRVSSYDQYLLVDGGEANPLGGFATGLEYRNGAPKPTYAAYRLPIFLPVTRTSRGRSLEIWGCARPALYARLQTRAPQSVSIQLQPASGRAFATLLAVRLRDPFGYFDVRAKIPTSGEIRLSWTYPHGPTILSRTVQVIVR